jgi:hypothetical protein
LLHAGFNARIVAESRGAAFSNIVLMARAA